MRVGARYHFYPSLCYWGLKQVGLVAGEPEVRQEKWSEELSRLGETFAFTPPLAGGPMFALLYQVPSYLDPGSPDELMRISEALQCFLRSERLDHFLDRWPDRTVHWQAWFTTPGLSQILDAARSDLETACSLVKRFMEYLAFLWTSYEPRYADRIDESTIGRRIEHMDPGIADEWGELLGVSYPYDAFELIICPESPSLASSLGPEKVILGQKHPLHFVEHCFVHEVGVRTVGLHRLADHPATRDLMMDDYVSVLKLIEAEVCYHKPTILAHLEEDLFLKGMGLEALVEWRKRADRSGRSLPEFFAHWYRESRRSGLI